MTDPSNGPGPVNFDCSCCFAFLPAPLLLPNKVTCLKRIENPNFNLYFSKIKINFERQLNTFLKCVDPISEFEDFIFKSVFFFHLPIQGIIKYHFQ